MKIKLLFFVLFLFICFVGCDSLDFENEFKLLISSSRDHDPCETLYFEGIIPDEDLNVHYLRLLKYGKQLTRKLLEKAESEASTYWCFELMGRPATEGEIAISVLWSVYGDKVTFYLKNLIPKEHYEGRGSLAIWQFVGSNRQNREKAIDAIKKAIDFKDN